LILYKKIIIIIKYPSIVIPNAGGTKLLSNSFSKASAKFGGVTTTKLDTFAS